MSVPRWKKPALCPPMNKSMDEQAFGAVLSMLRHIHKNEDVQPLSEELAFRFGSANAMFAADRHIWQQMELQPNDALLMSRISEISRYADQSRYNEHPRLSSLQPALNYLVSNYRGLQTERFYMLCLDKRGCLKEKVFLYEGTADCTLLNLRKMLREAVRISPAAVILSHNHPGGTFAASEDDVFSTRDAIRALSAIGIPVLDHVIIAGGRGFSMRLNGCIPEIDWLDQQMGNRMLASWTEMHED